MTTATPRREISSEAPRPATRAGWPSLVGVGLLAMLVVVLDQLSKAWITTMFGRAAAVHGQPIISGILDLHYGENRGAAFGLFQDGGLALGLIAAGVVVVIIVLVPRLQARPEGAPWLLLLALGLVLGGALGNLIDRVRLGYVVDFVTPTFARVTLGNSIYQFPTFNVADSAITVSVLILLVGFLFTGERGSKPGSPAAIPAADVAQAATTAADPPVRLTRAPGSGLAPITPLGLAGSIALVGGIWVWAVVKALQGRRKSKPKGR